MAKTTVQFRSLFLFAFSAFSMLCAKSQPFINGNLSTGTTSSGGTVAPAGYSWSEVQPPNTTLGFSVNISANTAALDDFTVPVGQIWNISAFICYAYSTGYSNAVTPPFNDMRVRIFDTDPTSGTATPVFGDLTTNRLTSSTPVQIYRTGTTTGTTRLIYGNTANITTTLNPGHYWIEWQMGTITGVTSNFSPPSTVVGTATQPGNNAWQHNTSTNQWTVLLDGGSSLRQDFPFIINYTVTTPPPCTGNPAPGNTISTANNVCSGQPFTLSLQNNPVASGLTYQWQSSTDGITWTDVPGANSYNYSTSETSSTYYRALVSCGTSSTPSNPVQVSIFSSYFSAQPANTSGNCGTISSINAAIGGTSPVLGYQWQQRPSVAASWENMANSPLVKGANDDTLVFLQTPAALSGYQFRLLYLDTCGAIHISDSALLTVTPFTAAVNPAVASVCSGQAAQLNVSGTETTIASYSSPVLTLGIPDTVKAGVVDSITVSGLPANVNITALSVKLNIAHTWAGDLAITLKAPNGKIINLDYYLTGTGGPGSTTGFANTVIGSNGSVFLADSSDPWTGYFRADRAITPAGSANPSGPSSLLANTASWDSLWLTSPNGTWKLGLYDGFAGDVGTLAGWSLDFTYSKPVTASWSPAGNIFTDPAATVPYTSGSQAATVYVKPTSTTVYSATPGNTICAAGSASTASVSVGVAIGTITPPADLSVCAGNPATFAASVSAGTDLSFQWQISTNGGLTWSNIPGANGTSYTIPAVSSSDNDNRFRLVVSNPCSTTPVNSAPAMLMVGAGPSITGQPVNTTACIGGGATYSISVAGPASTFQWQVSIDGGITWSNITTGGNNSILNLSSLSASDNNNRYRCQVTDCGITTASNAATLTMVAAASITGQPGSITVCAGSDVSFTATASGTSYQWQVSNDNGTTWNDIPGANATILTLQAVSASQNNTTYRLVVGNCGTSTINSNSATLTVNSPAAISAQPADVTVCEGTTASFSVTASGTSLSYQWQVSNDGGNTWSNISGANSNSYDLPAPAVTDNNNRYRVLVGSADPCNPVVSGAAKLTVNAIPIVGATVSPAAQVCAGTNIILSGSGASSYNWSNGASNGTAFPINSSATYTVTGTQNGCSATASVSIQVFPNPTVSVSASAGTSLLAGGSTILTATSNPAATSYKWFRNGSAIAGATGNSLTVTFSSLGDLGDYSVEVTDANGCKANSAETAITAANVALISPNPTGLGYFLVNIPSAGGAGLVRIVNLFDSKGALVSSQRFTSGASPMKVDARELSQGIYGVEVTDSNGNRIVTTKVVVSPH